MNHSQEAAACPLLLPYGKKEGRRGAAPNFVSEFLRHEFSHRVNNQLQLLLSHLELMKVSRVGKREALDRATGFIYAMAEVHDQLCRQHAVAWINARPFLESIGQSLIDMGSFGSGPKAVLDIQATKLPVVLAQQLGFLLSELLVAIFIRHRVPGCGTIGIQFRKAEEGWRLDIRTRGHESTTAVRRGGDQGRGDGEGRELLLSETLDLLLLQMDARLVFRTGGIEWITVDLPFPPSIEN
jgi:two-component sensor histidine kinase